MTLNLCDGPNGVEPWLERLEPGAVVLRASSVFVFLFSLFVPMNPRGRV